MAESVQSRENDSPPGEAHKTAEEAMAEITELMNFTKVKKGYKYTDGWDPEHLEEELKQHPFFITEMPKEGEPIPPLIEAFQQLKYSPDENSPSELAVNHKEDGHFHFKLKKYRIAASCYTEAIRHATSPKNLAPDNLLTAQLYNNRAACQYRIQNYGSSLKDCEKAVKLQPDYFKPVLKAIECCMALEKWDKAIELCAFALTVEKDNMDVKKFSSQASKNKRTADAKARRQVALQSRKKAETNKMLDLIKSRNIKLLSAKFLEEDCGTGKTVIQGSDGKLEWPVLIYYPQYSQSDFIEAFHEDTTFADHLMEILENDRPHWDSEGEYHLSTVDVYFTNVADPEYIKIDQNDTLQNILSQKRYFLPPNGVPAFIVLARDNEECKVILKRMQKS